MEPSLLAEISSNQSEVSLIPVSVEEEPQISKVLVTQPLRVWTCAGDAGADKWRAGQTKTLANLKEHLELSFPPTKET